MMLLGGALQLNTKGTRVRHDNRQLAVSCFGEVTRHEWPGEVHWGTREPDRDSRGPTSRRVVPGSGPYLGVCSCKFGQMPVLYVFGSWLSGLSQPPLACQVAMPWTRPEGEGRRAGRSPES